MSCPTLAFNDSVVFMQRTSIHVAAQHSRLARHAWENPVVEAVAATARRTLLVRGGGNGDVCSLAKRLLLLSAVLEG